MDEGRSSCALRDTPRLTIRSDPVQFWHLMPVASLADGRFTLAADEQAVAISICLDVATRLFEFWVRQGKRVWMTLSIP